MLKNLDGNVLTLAIYLAAIYFSLEGQMCAKANIVKCSW